jgi:hypothetical protein
MPFSSLHEANNNAFSKQSVNECLGFDSKFYLKLILEFIFQTTNRHCIGFGKNTTPIAKKNRHREQDGFLLGGPPSASSVPSLLRSKK